MEDIHGDIKSHELKSAKETLRALVKDLVAEPKATLLSGGVSASASVVEWAAARQPTLLVVGSRGSAAGGTRRIGVGSFTAAVLSGAPCAVLVVNEPVLHSMAAAAAIRHQAVGSSAPATDWKPAGTA